MTDHVDINQSKKGSFHVTTRHATGIDFLPHSCDLLQRKENSRSFFVLFDQGEDFDQRQESENFQSKKFV